MPIPLFLDSFEYQTAAIGYKWTTAPAGFIIEIGGGRDDQNAMSCVGAVNFPGPTIHVAPITPMEGICGYNAYLTQARGTTAPAGFIIEIGGGRDDQNAMSCVGAVNFPGPTIHVAPITPMEGICGYNAYLTQARGTTAGGYFLELAVMDSNNNVRLSFVTTDDDNGSGTVKVYRGAMPGGTLLGTSSAQMYVTGEDHLMEFAWKLNGTTGEVEVRRDGVTILHESPVNTGNGTWDRVSVMPGPPEKISHFYLMDRRAGNDFVGNWRVLARKPIANGNHNGWTPSAGANYECVDDDTPDLDTTYVQSPPQVAGLSLLQYEYELYKHAPVGAWWSKILSVQTNAYARKISAAYNNTLWPLVKRGDWQGASDLILQQALIFTSLGDPSLETGYKDKRCISPGEPGTPNLWTPATLDAAEFGFRHVRG